ncbi:MAG: hypothetical protein ACUVXD_17220 [Thermodesulfobacteriota bacterium]
MAQRVMERISQSIQDIGTVETEPRLEGRFMTMMIGIRS